MKTLLENVDGLRKLGATGALILLTLYFAYVIAGNYSDIATISRTVQAQANAESESIRVARKTCRAIHVVAKLDPSGCDEQGR